MTREIKFRAKDYKENWQVGTYYFGVMYPTSFEGHYVNDVLIDENTLGQYTGLKDANNVEIYEGDIVKDDEGYNLKVEYYNGRFVPLVYVKDGYNAIDKYDPKIFKVIGNIYENPELLG